jgi:hypothetical protein
MLYTPAVKAMDAKRRAMRHPGTRASVTCSNDIERLIAAAVSAIPPPRFTSIC